VCTWGELCRTGDDGVRGAELAGTGWVGAVGGEAVPTKRLAVSSVAAAGLPIQHARV
jgi:hypothetical protein